jgi:CRP-like cAMP-binding protein
MTLKDASFLAGLPEQLLAKLATLGRHVSFEVDQLILPAGQRSTDFYVLLSGSACIELRTRVYAVCIQVLHPGEAFGWSSLLTPHDTLFQVRAREASSGMSWNGSQLSAAWLSDPELRIELLQRVLGIAAERVKATESKLAELCGLSSVMR